MATSSHHAAFLDTLAAELELSPQLHPEFAASCLRRAMDVDAMLDRETMTSARILARVAHHLRFGRDSIETTLGLLERHLAARPIPPLHHTGGPLDDGMFWMPAALQLLIGPIDRGTRTLSIVDGVEPLADGASPALSAALSHAELMTTAADYVLAARFSLAEQS